MKSRRTWWVWIPLLAVLGCVRVEQTLTLHEDGSALLETQYFLSTQARAQMDEIQSMAAALAGMSAHQVHDVLQTAFDRRHLQHAVMRYGHLGVQCVTVEVEESEKGKQVNLVIRANSVRDLADAGLFFRTPVRLRPRDAGRWAFSLDTPPFPALVPPGLDDEARETLRREWKEMLGGMRIALHFKAPGEVVEAASARTDDRTVSWVFDVEEDASFLETLPDTRLHVVFEGGGVQWPVINP